MRLVIHGGLHKTATTSFQYLIHENQKNLSRFSILYPNLFGATSHNQLIFDILNDNWNSVDEFLKQSFQLACITEAKTVLISAEDFETALCNPHIANKFFAAVYAVGFIEIKCYFTLRGQWDYFNSLYAEMSKHRVCLKYEDMAEEIIKFGEISMGNSHTRWTFAFDYDKIIANFKVLTQVPVHTFTYQSFVNGRYIGDVLIEDLLGPTDSQNFFESANFIPKIFNKRSSDEDVEFKYITNFFGQPSSERAFDLVTKTLVPARLRQISTLRNTLISKFELRFPIIGARSQETAI